MTIASKPLLNGVVEFRNPDGALIPRYGFRDSPDLDRGVPDECPAGLYLSLFHGRKAVDEDLQDWGCDGPALGPLKYVHTTYATDVKLDFVDPKRARFYGFEPTDFMALAIHDDMLVCAGIYFGDWTVFYHQPGA